MCDPIWHLSSRCGEASCELLYSVYFILLYTSAGCRPQPTHSAAATAAARSPTLVLLFLSLVSVCVCMSVYLSVCLSVCRCFGMCPEISLSIYLSFFCVGVLCLVSCVCLFVCMSVCVCLSVCRCVRVCLVMPAVSSSLLLLLLFLCLVSTEQLSPHSKHDVYRHAAVASDAAPCSKVGRYVSWSDKYHDSSRFLHNW